MNGYGRTKHTRDAMNELFEDKESERLRQSWQRHGAESLDTYLVSGVEDPRVNIQSILNRALLCEALFPGGFLALIDEELRFGFVMTWLLKHLELGIDKRSLTAAIRAGRRDRCPDFVLETFQSLQETTDNLPDYISASLADVDGHNPVTLSSDVLNTFQRIWCRKLARLSCSCCSLFEPACGSANDYRYLDSYGFTAFVRYTGLDIAPKNIDNAHRRFPSADFRIGDLLNSGLEDDAFDLSFVHDLFEHLSIPAMERAIRELLRVTRREVWLHFFNAGDIPSHRVRPVACYHWNALSVRELVRIVEQSATRVEVVSIAGLAKTKFGFGRYYNPGAYTIIATK
jgi:hypothetical protein